VALEIATRVSRRKRAELNGGAVDETQSAKRDVAEAAHAH
jgi:hypothetical protein